MRISWGNFRHWEIGKSLKIACFTYLENFSSAPTWAGPCLLHKWSQIVETKTHVFEVKFQKNCSTENQIFLDKQLFRKEAYINTRTRQIDLPTIHGLGDEKKMPSWCSWVVSDDEHQQQQHHFSLMGRREPPRLDDCYLSISPSPYFHPSESLGEMDRCFKCRRRLRNHCDCQVSYLVIILNKHWNVALSRKWNSPYLKSFCGRLSNF